MSKPIELPESGGEVRKPHNVDPKIWNTDAPQHVQPMLSKEQNLSVVKGNELVVDSAFEPTDGSVKLSGPVKMKIETSALAVTPTNELKSEGKFKSPATLKLEQATLGESTLGAPVLTKASSFEVLPSSHESSIHKASRSIQLENPALGSDLVSKQLTVPKSERTVLPSVDFVESRSIEPIHSKQPVLQARVEHQEVPSQVQPLRLEARPVQITQIEGQQPAPRLLDRMSDVVQNKNNQPDLQIVEKIAPKPNLHIASNAVIERGDDNSMTVQNARSERPVSARLEQVITQTDTIAISPEARLVKLATAPECVRFISTPSNNLVGFSRSLEIAQVASLRPQASFNIRGQETVASGERIKTVLAQPTRIQPLESLQTLQQSRSHFVAGIVKSVLTSLQTAQGADAQAQQVGPKTNLDAQSIIKANLNPQQPGTTGNAALVVRADFTIRDFRLPQTNTGLTGQVGDIRTNVPTPTDIRTDARSPIAGVNGLELSFGKRKKKDLVGPTSATTAESTCEDSRYITGLELGLIIALAGIAKFDPNDRTNRKVFNPLDTQSHSTVEESKIAKLIGKSIENKKVSKRLPSYNWTHEWKSPGKIKVKNVLEKLKKERKDLNAKDFEKLESSTNAEELMSRLGKMSTRDKKSLDKKHMLSSFSQTLREKLQVKQNTHTSQTQAASNYRPLWLVCENDSLTILAEQIYQDPDVGWLIADMNSSRVRETWNNHIRIIQMQSRQQIELPIQEDIDLFKQSKTQDHCAENLITVVIQNQLDKDHLNSQLQALQINRKAVGTT
jgi:hypothetical protein